MNMERVSRRGLLAVSASLVGAAGMNDTIRTTAVGTNATGSQTINHIVIFGGSPKTAIEYGFTVSGRLRKSGSGDGAPIADRFVTIDVEDRISNRGQHASGAIAGGGDAYRFTGRITRFRVSLSAERQNEVKVYLNGRRVRPDSLGDAPAANTPVEFLDCDTARVTGSFQGVRLHTSFWDEAGLGTNVLFLEPVNGTTILHPVAAHDPYPFAIDSVSLDTRKLETPGQPAKFTADNPYAGPWCRKWKGRRSRGSGQSSSEGKRKSDGETGHRTVHIEFLDCDRAVVTGDFERVTINTSWYASDGFATSYNEIGPVSGQTKIDGSNVGDVGESGFVIVDVAAYESGSAEPTISKRNPNTDACNLKLERKTTTGTTETTTTETGTTDTTGAETTKNTRSESKTTRKTKEPTQKSETTRRNTADPTTSRQVETDGEEVSTSRESSTPAESTVNSVPETPDGGSETASGGGTSGGNDTE